VRVWSLVDVLTGAIVLGVGLSRISSDVSVADALAFAVALVLGAVLIYCFWLILATVAFRVVNMWHMVELFDGIFQTGRWPIGIYPPWLRFGVTFLVPVAFAVTVPAEALTSRLDWQTLLLAFVFAAALFAGTRWFWRRGLRQYTGASA
jgi:ABC-2 type transport system permease protein